METPFGFRQNDNIFLVGIFHKPSVGREESKDNETGKKTL